jgi:hypothetical protein
VAAADRARRLAAWAAAVSRAPTSTPPTVPWEGPRRPGAGARDLPPGRRPDPAGPAGAGVGGELRELRDAGVRWAGDKAAELRDAWRPDPAKVHAKRLRKAGRTARARSWTAGGLGAASAAAYPLVGLEPVILAGGGLSAVVAGGAVLAGRELRRLRALPVPPPRAPRPPRDSPAREPLDRLAGRERALHELLAHLGDAGTEPRLVAADAARGLRELGARLSAVDRARRATGAGDLDAAVAGLTARLHAGVEAYAALVVAAADAVAADSHLRAPDLRLQEATDALAGLAEGLRELAA